MKLESIKGYLIINQTMLNIDVTCSHIEQAAKKLSGSAGISGFDSYQLQRVLLREGKHSDKLQESFAKATKIQANKILDWEEVRALKTKRLIALRKLPVGCHPVGIAEAADRYSKKVIGIIAGDDVIEACRSFK